MFITTKNAEEGVSLSVQCYGKHTQLKYNSAGKTVLITLQNVRRTMLNILIKSYTQEGRIM